MLIALSHSPRLYYADSFATGKEIAHILAGAADGDGLARQGVTTRHDETGFSFEMPVGDDAVLNALAARVQRVLGVANDLAGTMRFRRYGVGESHPPHLDCYTIGASHLIVTALLYLTDTPVGGETYFPHARPVPVWVKPRRGRLTCWFNYYPNGMQDPAAMHEALPVLEGEKATITSFLYRPIDDASVRVPAEPLLDFEGILS